MIHTPFVCNWEEVQLCVGLFDQRRIKTIFPAALATGKVSTKIGAKKLRTVFSAE